MMKGNAILNLLDTVKMWMSGTETIARQRVFAPELNRKRKARLQALANPVLCLTPSRPKSPLPYRIQWQPLPESTSPPTELYATARQIVDAQVKTIKTYLPDFFKNPELQIDYESTYKMNRQQTLAINGLAFLSQVFESVEIEKNASSTPNNPSTDTRPVILDSPISPALLDEKTLDQLHFPQFSTLFCPVEPLQTHDFKRRRVAVKAPTFPKPTVLLVMSAPVHYELAEVALKHLETEYSIVIYFANPDKLEETLRQSLSQRYFTVDAHKLMPGERLAKSVCRYFNRCLQQIEALPIPAPLRDALAAELVRLSDTLHIMTLLETVISLVRPAVVLGCMEKNRMSIAFKTLQSRYPFKLLNFQHGIMPLTHNLDWQQFDRFFVWNPLTRNVVVKDGYQWPDSIAVVGNPLWEKGSSGHQKPLSTKAQEIKAWQGDSILLGAYTQYAGDYLTHEARRNYLKALFAYLEARPTIKLLIKKHPLETDTLAEDMLTQSQVQERVVLCAGKELDLWESFSLIHLSTTICSTTLLDSLKVNVPAVALDFTDIIADIGYGYDEEPGITIIRDAETVPAMLDALLEQITQQAISGQPALDASTQSLVYPNLPGTYSDRIRENLVALGLLDNAINTPVEQAEQTV